MSPSPADVARAWFAEVWNAGSEAAIDKYMGPQAAFHGLTPDGSPIIGPAGFKPFYRKFREAFPDIRINVERTVTEGELVAVHCTVTGTHLGASLGIAATRKPVKITGMAMARVRDGKVVEGWNAFDFLSLYQQVGMVPG
ncbi:MAG TPA: ester cyclase [Casimicrobiaceae bacterium]|nr:ester cyclase [Casimicrobiaceae bacterium]